MTRPNVSVGAYWLPFESTSLEDPKCLESPFFVRTEKSEEYGSMPRDEASSESSACPQQNRFSPMLCLLPSFRVIMSGRFPVLFPFESVSHPPGVISSSFNRQPMS